MKFDRNITVKCETLTEALDVIEVASKIGYISTSKPNIEDLRYVALGYKNNPTAISYNNKSLPDAFSHEVIGYEEAMKHLKSGEWYVQINNEYAYKTFSDLARKLAPNTRIILPSNPNFPMCPAFFKNYDGKNRIDWNDNNEVWKKKGYQEITYEGALEILKGLLKEQPIMEQPMVQKYYVKIEHVALFNAIVTITKCTLPVPYKYPIWLYYDSGSFTINYGVSSATGYTQKTIEEFLEAVKEIPSFKNHPIEITNSKREVKIGCQTVPFSTLQEIKKRMTNLWQDNHEIIVDPNNETVEWDGMEASYEEMNELFKKVNI